MLHVSSTEFSSHFHPLLQPIPESSNHLLISMPSMRLNLNSRNIPLLLYGIRWISTISHKHSIHMLKQHPRLRIQIISKLPYLTYTFSTLSKQGITSSENTNYSFPVIRFEFLGSFNDNITNWTASRTSAFMTYM